MDRRKFLQWTLNTACVVLLAKMILPPRGLGISNALAAEMDKLNLPDDEWKKRLSPEAYAVLRQESTERPFTSPLNDEHRSGMFACAGCDQTLFPSTFKFNSGTGWPSFFDAIPGHVESKTDYKLIVPRTEYHCSRCGGHHGHIFSDGPKPTGLRYCNNGVALKFIPDKA